MFAGQGDAHRSMALLWRGRQEGADRSAPGPRPALSVDAIVVAAIGVADAEGMAALSMRAVGERLGRTAMALYTYVPGKDVLIELMYDHALAELPACYDTAGGWRRAATAWARDYWAFLLRHPWVLEVSQARPVLGPNEYAALEALAAVLRGAGLQAGAVSRVSGALTGLVRGAAQTVAETRWAPRATGVTDEDWWHARAAALDELVPDFAASFPTLTWMEGEGAYDPRDESVPYLEQAATDVFEAGLGVLLDGVEAAAGRSAPAAD